MLITFPFISLMVFVRKILINLRLISLWSEINLLINSKTTKKFVQYMKKYTTLYEHLAKVIKKNLPQSLDKPLIIDLGAGPGLLSTAIFKSMPETDVINLDASIEMLEMAEKHAFKDNFRKFGVILSTSENIPIKSNSVDIVVSRFSLPYWKQPKISFEEMFRILKSGGKVVLETLNKDFPKWKLFFVKLHMLINLAGRDVIRYHIDAYKIAYNIEQVENFLINSKFSIIKKEGIKKDWKFTIIAEKP